MAASSCNRLARPQQQRSGAPISVPALQEPGGWRGGGRGRAAEGGACDTAAPVIVCAFPTLFASSPPLLSASGTPPARPLLISIMLWLLETVGTVHTLLVEALWGGRGVATTPLLSSPLPSPLSRWGAPPPCIPWGTSQNLFAIQCIQVVRYAACLIVSTNLFAEALPGSILILILVYAR